MVSTFSIPIIYLPAIMAGPIPPVIYDNIHFFQSIAETTYNTDDKSTLTISYAADVAWSGKSVRSQLKTELNSNFNRVASEKTVTMGDSIELEPLNSESKFETEFEEGIYSCTFNNLTDADRVKFEAGEETSNEQLNKLRQRFLFYTPTECSIIQELKEFREDIIRNDYTETELNELRKIHSETELNKLRKAYSEIKLNMLNSFINDTLIPCFGEAQATTQGIDIMQQIPAVLQEINEDKKLSDQSKQKARKNTFRILENTTHYLLTNKIQVRPEVHKTKAARLKIIKTEIEQNYHDLYSNSYTIKERLVRFFASIEQFLRPKKPSQNYFFKPAEHPTVDGLSKKVSSIPVCAA